MTKTSPRILIVGAGAVGQVYGRHLQRGGASVTFLVKPHHVSKLQAPLRFYPLNSYKLTDPPVEFSEYNLVTEPPSASEPGFDQVWLCVSSTALRQPWLKPLCSAIGDATVVSLLPGIEDRKLLLEYVPEERLVTGLITIISYPAPLPGEPEDAKGMAYWFPPLGPTPLSGPPERRDAAVRLLRAGGQPAKTHRDVAAISGFPTAVLMPILMGLEASNWKFKHLANSEHGPRALNGVREAIAVVSALHGVSRPWWLPLLTMPTLRALLWAAPMAVPLPLETYLGFHFTKVGDQTRLFIDTYIRLAETQGKPSHALTALRSHLKELAAA